MNLALTRASLLLQQSRFDMAAEQLRRALAEAPHDAHAHALLGVCLARQDKLDEAQREAEQAIVHAPDWAFSHYCRSVVLEHRHQFKEAEKSAREAVRLDPADVDNYSRLAGVLFAQRQWQAALNAAVEGLAHDAEHTGCSHLRTMALTRLNRKQEALASVDQSLARDPDNAMAHTNKGWALLHQGIPRPALEHFREALRIEPSLEYARQGMVEALKARNIVYRWMLAYFLWMARMSNGARWAVILGGWFGARVLNNAARQVPELAPWITPLLVLYIAFAVLTWFAMPLFNLLLRLNRFGRHALSRDQRMAANWFGGCLAAFAGGLAGYFATQSATPLVVGFCSLGMALPLTILYSCSRGWPRQGMVTFAGALAVVGLAAIAGVSFGQEWGFTFFMAFCLGAVATPWIANVLVGVTVRR
jgi:tetratricopeptide (TPR) repeat protein